MEEATEPNEGTGGALGAAYHGKQGQTLQDMPSVGGEDITNSKEDGKSRMGIYDFKQFSKIEIEAGLRDEVVSPGKSVKVKEYEGAENKKTESLSDENETLIMNQNFLDVTDSKNLMLGTETPYSDYNIVQNISDKHHNDLQTSTVTQDSIETNKIVQDSLAAGRVENQLHPSVIRKGNQNQNPESSPHKEQMEDDTINTEGILGRPPSQGKHKEGETHGGMKTEPGTDEEGIKITLNNKVSYLEDSVDAHMADDTARDVEVSHVSEKALEETHERSNSHGSSVVQGEILEVFPNSTEAPEHPQGLDKLQESPGGGKAHEYKTETKKTVDDSQEASIILQDSQHENKILAVSKSVNKTDDYSGTEEDQMEHHEELQILEITEVSKTSHDSNETLHKFHDLSNISEDSHGTQYHHPEETDFQDPDATENIFVSSSDHKESLPVTEEMINHKLIRTKSVTPGLKIDQDSAERMGGFINGIHNQKGDTVFAFTTPSFPETLEAPEVNHHFSGHTPSIDLPEITSPVPIITPVTPELHINDGSVPQSENVMKNDGVQQSDRAVQNKEVFSSLNVRDNLESLTTPGVDVNTFGFDRWESSSILQEHEENTAYKTVICPILPCDTAGIITVTEKTLPDLYMDLSDVTETTNPAPGKEAATTPPPVIVPKTLPPLHLNSEEELRAFLLSLETLPKAGTSSVPQGDTLLDIKDRNQGKSTSYLSWLWG